MIEPGHLPHNSNFKSTASATRRYARSKNSHVVELEETAGRDSEAPIVGSARVQHQLAVSGKEFTPQLEGTR